MLYMISKVEQIVEKGEPMEDMTIRPCYLPLQWMPHTTIGKKLSREEMLMAFQMMQNQFGGFSGKAVKVGLAKTNPDRDLVVVDW